MCQRRGERENTNSQHDGANEKKKLRIGSVISFFAPFVLIVVAAIRHRHRYRHHCQLHHHQHHQSKT